MVGECPFLILDGFVNLFLLDGEFSFFIFVKTGTGGTGTGGRRNRLESNRTVGFLEFTEKGTGLVPILCVSCGNDAHTIPKATLVGGAALSKGRAGWIRRFKRDC